MIYNQQNFKNGDVLTAKHLEKMERGILANGALEPYLGSPSLYVPEILDDENIDNMTSEELYALYDELEATYPLWIKREADLGVDKPIRHYCIRFFEPIVNGESGDTLWTNEWIPEYDYDNILITMGVHGNEKSAVYGGYIFIRDLLSSEEDWATFIKSNFIIHFIPLINVWGFDNFSRNNEQGININRDYEDCRTEEARSVVDLANSLGEKLKVIIDTHNTVAAYGWIGGIPDDVKFDTYRKAYAKVTAALLPFHKKMPAYFDKDNYYPYCFIKYSPNEGTMNSWGNKRGYFCNTIEAPRTAGITGNVNSKNASPMLAALLGNLMQIYGVMDNPRSFYPVTFTINPVPSTAIVTLNGIQTNSIEVKGTSAVNWAVEAQGYGRQKGIYMVTDDSVLNVTLGTLILDWVIGQITIATGQAYAAAGARQVTMTMFSGNEANKIVANGDYEFLLYAYTERDNDLSIIGRYSTDGTFKKSGTGQWLTEINLADFPREYYYRVLCRCKSDTNQTFTDLVLDCAIVS